MNDYEPTPEQVDLPLDAAKLDAMGRLLVSEWDLLDIADMKAQARAALTLRDELNGAREASATELRHAYDELAECRSKLAQAEQERACGCDHDGAGGCIHARAVDDLRRWLNMPNAHGLDCTTVAGARTAALQAENIRLREALRGVMPYAYHCDKNDLDGFAEYGGNENLSRAEAALASPTDDSALREMMLKWAGGVWALAAPDREIDANTITAELDRRFGGGK